MLALIIEFQGVNWIMKRKWFCPKITDGLWVFNGLKQWIKESYIGVLAGIRYFTKQMNQKKNIR